MAESLPTIYYVLQIAIPATLIISGWFVVYKNSKSIESRKEARDFVECMEDLIDKIHRDSILYFSKDNEFSIGPLSSAIKSNSLLLSHYLFVLKGLGIEFKGSPKLTAFRKSITGGFFETTNFHKQTEIPGWSEEISNCAAELKLSLRTAYFTWCGTYTPPTPPPHHSMGRTKI